MTRDTSIHQWSVRDKLLYAVILIPFLAAFLGAAYLLATASIYLAIVFLLLYVGVNVFQAGCCVGCPYRGKYCPAVFGVYLGNFLSATVYRKRDFESRFFRTNATFAEILVVATFLFPIYWLLLLNWYYLVAFLILMVVHIVLFYPTVCPKCSYNDTCPGGQAVHKLFKRGGGNVG